MLPGILKYKSKKIVIRPFLLLKHKRFYQSIVKATCIKHRFFVKWFLNLKNWFLQIERHIFYFALDRRQILFTFDFIKTYMGLSFTLFFFSVSTEVAVLPEVSVITIIMKNQDQIPSVYTPANYTLDLRKGYLL